MTDIREERDAAFDLLQKYLAEEGTVLLTGIQAVVRVVLDQMRADRRRGLRTASFVSGYPGSPLGGVDREFGVPKDLLRQLDIVHRSGHNEDLAATAVAGSQVASTLPKARYEGVVGVWYGKAPGLDRSIDAIRHGQYVGTSPLGGVLALVGDDPASKSSSAPSGSELTIRAVGMPMLEPGTSEEIVTLGLHGVAMSRVTGLWSAMRITTPVADGISTTRVWPGQADVVVPSVHWRGAPYVPTLTPNVTGQFAIDTEAELLGVRYDLARAYGAVNKLNKIVVESNDDWIGIASRGYVWHELQSAFAILGLDESELSRYGVRLLHVGMPDPIDPGLLRRFGKGLREIVVVEEKRSFLEGTLREALYGVADAPQIVGKHDEKGESLFPIFGTLDADRIAAAIAGRLAQRIDPANMRTPRPTRRLLSVASANRSAYLCSGCPHNSSLRVPDGVLLGGGIGCHALGGRMDPAMFGVTAFKTHMGGEGAGWIGMEPFVEDGHLIQNIGDGTFFHSGQLAVQAAIAAGSHITYKLLFNGAIAMTGGQSTSSSNGLEIPELVQVLVHQGVTRVIVTTDELERYRKVTLPGGVDVWDRTRIIEAQELLAKVGGVTVLIHDQQCAAEKRRDRKRGRVAEPRERIVINERVCEGCGDCGVKSNCLSVEPVDTEFGRKTRINQTSCNKDYSCVRGECPSFLTVVPPRKKRPSTGPRAGVRRVEHADLPEPASIGPVSEYVIRMPGIGGTGVVTVNQILGTAAVLEGRLVSGLDQTGLSQKAGPVVSDLRITTDRHAGGSANRSNRPVNGSVDLYLVFDLIVGVSASNLQGVDPTRTVAVVSTSRTPTGDMVSHVDSRYPDQASLEAAISSSVLRGRMFGVDSHTSTRALFGDTDTANVYLVGVAYQLGVLPLRAQSIERAIELNGVAVDKNVQAFRWGRLGVAEPGRLEGVLGLIERRRADGIDQGDVGRNASATGEDALAALVARASPAGNDDFAMRVRLRILDLIDYQNRLYAERYVELLEGVRRKEAAVAPESSELSEAVALHLHRLMAYKDEYEVARLQLDPAQRAQILEQFGAGTRIAWNLQPPTLRWFLRDRKLTLGRWFTPVMIGLRAGRRLRGTPFDIFGYTKMRRTERALVREYEAVVRAVIARLDVDSLSAAVALARLPEKVRGYERVKAANIEQYRKALRTAASDLSLPY